MTTRHKNIDGFSLIELMVIIIVAGILVSVAMKSMNTITSDIRETKTIQEMEILAKGLVGDPDRANNGTRSDFGYVGDIGGFPSNLQALAENPGLGTWQGPYLPAGFVQDTTGYKLDEWGQAYAYNGSTQISSTGGGSLITKQVVENVDDYLLNSFLGLVKDAADSVPGTIYIDSLTVVITIPDGSGSTSDKTYTVDSAGNFQLDSLPVGLHPLKIIYTPVVDTLLRYITILPRHKSQPIPVYHFASAYFTTVPTGPTDSILTKVTGSDSIYAGWCNNISFWIENNTGSSIDVSSIKLTWSGATAFFRYVRWDGVTVFNQTNSKPGSGDNAVFTSAQTINDGESIKIQVEDFRSSTNGGSRFNMQNTTFSVEFSEGSSFDVTVGVCP